MTVRLLLSLLFATAAAAGCTQRTVVLPRDDAGVLVVFADAGPIPEDVDGDFIRNEDEGFPDRDSDGDGTPDYQDADSDNDSLIDRLEAGDDDLDTPVVDSDGDGTPDVLDTDSDDNGLPDRLEGSGDLDGDRILNFADPDDDGDGVEDVRELGDGSVPRDTDRDGEPDYRDLDSDGDSILDAEESDAGADPLPDTDGDLTPDFLDRESDGDQVFDSVEAGDEALVTPAVDTDGDGVPDYRDLDSDNDFLEDFLEKGLELSRVDPDTDEDGTSDWIEFRIDTDPLNENDNPGVRGEPVFMVPADGPIPVTEGSVQMRSQPLVADVYFLVETTTGMADAAMTLRAQTESILEELRCPRSQLGCVGDFQCGEGERCGPGGLCMGDPSVNACLAEVYSGVGQIGGAAGSYRNLVSLQGDPTLTAAATPALATAVPDAVPLFSSVRCALSRAFCGPEALCARSGFGCGGFRDNAVRFLAVLANEDGSGDIAPNFDLFTPFPRDIRRVAADAGSADEPDAALTAIDAQAAAGEGPDAVAALSRRIREELEGIELRAQLIVSEVDGDDGDAARFLTGFEVVDGEGCRDADTNTLDTDLDGLRDTYVNARPGDDFCWSYEVVLPPGSRPPTEPLLFTAFLDARGDGALLDTRRVHIVVPPGE